MTSHYRTVHIYASRVREQEAAGHSFISIQDCNTRAHNHITHCMHTLRGHGVALQHPRAAPGSPHPPPLPFVPLTHQPSYRRAVGACSRAGVRRCGCKQRRMNAGMNAAVCYRLRVSARASTPRAGTRCGGCIGTTGPGCAVQPPVHARYGGGASSAGARAAVGARTAVVHAACSRAGHHACCFLLGTKVVATPLGRATCALCSPAHCSLAQPTAA